MLASLDPLPPATRSARGRFLAGGVRSNLDTAVKGALDRSIAGNPWSKDGFLSEKGYALDMSVVAKTGEFTTTIAYGDVIDNSFVKKHQA